MKLTSNQSNLARAFSLHEGLVALGQWIMDFGFSGLVEKFEEYFGKRATKVLLGIIGLTVFIWCGGFVYNNLVFPIWDFFFGKDNSEATRFVQTVLGTIAGSLAGITLIVILSALNLLLPRRFRLLESKASKVIERAQEAMTEAKEMTAQSQSRIDEIDEIYGDIVKFHNENPEAFEKIIKKARKKRDE